MTTDRSAPSPRAWGLTLARTGLTSLLVLSAVLFPPPASGQTPTDRVACRDSAMHFTGLTLDAAGDTTLQKLIFMPVSPDTVRQTFQISTDRGAHWETTWVGTYVRRETP